MSGVARNVLIDVEHGRRSMLYERIIDIAEALNVPIEAIYSTIEPEIR